MKSQELSPLSQLKENSIFLSNVWNRLMKLCSIKNLHSN